MQATRSTFPYTQSSDGARTLYVHSWGYTETHDGGISVPIFSSLSVDLIYGRRGTTLEEVFQRSRIFKLHDGTLRRPRSWRQAREWLLAGFVQHGWNFGVGSARDAFPVQREAGKLLSSDPGVRASIALWCDFLKIAEGQRRLSIAGKFDDYHDPWKGDFSFGPEYIFRTAVKEGVEALDIACGDIRDFMLQAEFLEEVVDSETDEDFNEAAFVRDQSLQNNDEPEKSLCSLKEIETIGDAFEEHGFKVAHQLNVDGYWLDLMPGPILGRSIRQQTTEISDCLRGYGYTGARLMSLALFDRDEGDVGFFINPRHQPDMCSKAAMELALRLWREGRSADS